ncbi:MAG: hypothetical protein DCC75_01675 [Proteobacteria bacterium]|nr:MAG: hypothetical protein DCC75_01675 [Pseudomonadota bacterium]
MTSNAFSNPLSGAAMAMSEGGGSTSAMGEGDQKQGQCEDCIYVSAPQPPYNGNNPSDNNPSDTSNY